jgi:hypothetical protein
MRKLLLGAVLLAACAKGDAPATDTMAMDTAARTTTLSAADVEGTWSGSTMMEGSDSVVSRWTATGRGSEGALVYEGTTDSIRYTTTFDGDSMVVVSQPHSSPVDQQQVTFRSVGRLQGGRLVGTATNHPAGNADSVIVRSRWEATRNP